jgi:hypothetical protein
MADTTFSESTTRTNERGSALESLIYMNHMTLARSELVSGGKVWVADESDPDSLESYR